MMTFYKDLTFYEYSRDLGPAGIPVLNVGWLGENEFDKGETSAEFRSRLLQFCRDDHVVLIMRGFHACSFCKMSAIEWSYNGLDYGPNSRSMSIGNGEIRVIGHQAIYAAPTLIYHYVVEHNYLPPTEFVDAVLTGPQAGSDEHIRLLSAYKGK